MEYLFVMLLMKLWLYNSLKSKMLFSPINVLNFEDNTATALWKNIRTGGKPDYAKRICPVNVN